MADGTKTVSTKYTYNALGQLTKTQKGLGQAQNVANWYNEEIYTYDNYGNRTGTEVYEVNEGITGSEKIGDVRYSYDESNQMVKYETKGTEEESWTEKARNVYNGEGMRIRQYENGNSWARQYFYIGGALAISTDGSNENFVKSENILMPDGTILAALREAKAGEEIEGNAYWIYHYDARGSATNLVGAKNGNLYRAEENIYDAFGNEEKEIKQSTSSVVNDIKFTGAVLDNSGTYYLGSRHYDPNTGRFLQQDTFKGEAYSPWTQNLYTYTSNNPVNYVDPTGHWSYPCNNDSPFYKPGQSYNDAMRLYRQERSAGRIPQVPKQTSKPPTDGDGGGTTSPGNSQNGKPKGKPKNRKGADGTLNVPVYIMGMVGISDETKAKEIIVGAFDQLSIASGGSTKFKVQFVNNRGDASFVYNIRGASTHDRNNASNYYEKPDRIDLCFDSVSTHIQSMAGSLVADQRTVIEESMHMAGMLEEHYVPKDGRPKDHVDIENCPYEGTFLRYDNKYTGTGPNKQMADVIEYYVTTGSYNYTYCTWKH